MDHIKIIRRALAITRSYRALWVFGVLLALTTAQGGSSGESGTRFETGSGETFPDISPEMVSTLVAAGIAVLCVVLVLALAGVVLRYLSETALIRMVDQYEASGEQVTMRQGFRLGWSRSAFRMFLIDLLLGLLTTVAAILLLLIAAAPLLVWLTESTPARVLGTVVSVGMGLLVIFGIIVTSIALSLLLEFFHRAVVLENLGVIEGIRRGWQRVRQRMGDVLVMGLILFALGLDWAILLIPLTILLLLAAAVLGGLPALLVATIFSLFTQGSAPWIAAGIVAIPIVLMVVGAPLIFLSGLLETFKSSTWTLTYRELLALGGQAPAAPVAAS
jgi:hypothetical protein